MIGFRKIILFILSLVIIFAFSSCQKNDARKTVDYSEYPFTDISWTRKAEHDIETIRFNSDGSFAYSCGCGNPVNDSDLNEGYTYDDETKTITIDYIETTDETVSKIKIEMCDKERLKLNFDGEIRGFVVSL